MDDRAADGTGTELSSSARPSSFEGDLIEGLLGDLDAILDAWFLAEVQPALDEALRARDEFAGRAA